MMLYFRIEWLLKISFVMLEFINILQLCKLALIGKSQVQTINGRVQYLQSRMVPNGWMQLHLYLAQVVIKPTSPFYVYCS